MQGERAEDGRIYWGRRPDEMAGLAMTHATEDGFRLDLRPQTPVAVDELHTGRGITAGTWSEIDLLLRAWAEIGCAWVNLRFGIEPDGEAIVRVEANPSGEPLANGGLPACNGGFDCHRLLSPADFERHMRRAR